MFPVNFFLPYFGLLVSQIREANRRSWRFPRQTDLDFQWDCALFNFHFLIFFLSLVTSWSHPISATIQIWVESTTPRQMHQSIFWPNKPLKKEFFTFTQSNSKRPIVFRPGFDKSFLQFFLEDIPLMNHFLVIIENWLAFKCFEITIFIRFIFTSNRRTDMNAGIVCFSRLPSAFASQTYILIFVAIEFLFAPKNLQKKPFLASKWILTFSTSFLGLLFITLCTFWLIKFCRINSVEQIIHSINLYFISRDCKDFN